MTAVRSLWPGRFVPTAPVFPKDIVREVAREHGMTMDELTAPTKVRRVAHARWVAMARLRERTKLSLPQIGRLLGLKDHATVIHGLRAYAKQQEAAHG